MNETCGNPVKDSDRFRHAATLHRFGDHGDCSECEMRYCLTKATTIAERYERQQPELAAASAALTKMGYVKNADGAWCGLCQFFRCVQGRLTYKGDDQGPCPNCKNGLVPILNPGVETEP